LDWRVLATTFAMVFLAELGDKTQLAALAMTARSRSPVAVFLGAVGALVLATFLGVALGQGVSRLVPPHYIQRAAAISFLAIGAFMLLSS
jgi:putative Ca2+/H+ antiporter (TMEM165/GDT1 family)